jgi:hypothetical protein
MMNLELLTSEIELHVDIFCEMNVVDEVQRWLEWIGVCRVILNSVAFGVTV